MDDVGQALMDFYQDRVSMRIRHESGARQVSSYEFNNTYQYVLAREETHLQWLRDAIDGIGLTVPPIASAGSAGEVPRGEHAVIEDDARSAGAFVDRWRPRVDRLGHARHRKMLGIILGETLEHKRFFDQAVAGRTDLLGRRLGVGTGGGVRSSRSAVEEP